MYSIIDATTGYNLVTGRHEERSRIRLARGYDGGEDAGHTTKLIWDTPAMTLVRASQGGAIATAPKGKYVSHSRLDEYEFLLSGEAVFHNPGEEPLTLVAGDCICNPAGQPHSMVTTSIEPAELAVILDGTIRDSDRIKCEPAAKERSLGRSRVSRASGRENVFSDAGVSVREVFTAAALAVFEVALDPVGQFSRGSLPRIAGADEMLLVLEGSGEAIYGERGYPLYRDVSLYHGPEENPGVRASAGCRLKMLAVISKNGLN